MRHKFLTLATAILTNYSAIAADASPFAALQAHHPEGVPWKVEISDLEGKPAGSLELRITRQTANSCLGGMDGGLRVEYTRKNALPASLPVESYGVAIVSGDKIKIDLTGGMCDAYLILEGTLAPDGSSTGTIHTFGMRGGKDVARYRAIVQ